MMAMMSIVSHSCAAGAAVLLLMLAAGCICVNGQTALPSPTFTCEGSPVATCQAQTLTAVSTVVNNNGPCAEFFYGAAKCPKLPAPNSGPFFCSSNSNDFPLVITYTCPAAGSVTVTFGASSVRECAAAAGAVQLVYGTGGEVIAEARSGTTRTATFCCPAAGATFSLREVLGSGPAAIKVIAAPTITACPASPAPCPCRVEAPTFTCEDSPLASCKDQALTDVLAVTDNGGACPEFFYGAAGTCPKLATDPPSGPFFCSSNSDDFPLVITYKCPAAGSVSIEFGASSSVDCGNAIGAVQLVYGTRGRVIAEAASGTTKKVTFCCSAVGDTFSIREKKTDPTTPAAIRIIAAPTIAACLDSAAPCSCRVEAPTFTCEDSPLTSCKDQTLASVLTVTNNGGACPEFFYGTALTCPQLATTPPSGPFFCSSNSNDFPLVITYKCPAAGSVSIEFGASSSVDCGNAIGAVQLVYGTQGRVIAEATSGTSTEATFCCPAVGATFSLREKFGSGPAAIKIIAAPTIEPCRVGESCPCRSLAPPVLGAVDPARYTCLGAPADGSAGTLCVNQPLAAINSLNPEGCQLFYSSAKQAYCANAVSRNFLFCYDNRIPPGTDSILQQEYLCRSTGSVSVGFRAMPRSVCGATGSVTLQPPNDVSTGTSVAQSSVVAEAGEAKLAEFCCTSNQRFTVTESGIGTTGIEIRQQPTLAQCTERCPCRIPLTSSKICSCKSGESKKCLSTRACPTPTLQPSHTYLAIDAKLPPSVQGYDGAKKCAIAIWYMTTSGATKLLTVDGKLTPCLLEVLPFGCAVRSWNQGASSVSYTLGGCTNPAQNTQRVFNYAVCAAGDCCQLGAYLQTAINKVPTCT